MKFNENSAIVKKSNDLILTKCDLSLLQQKIICVALSQIFKDDIELKPFNMPTAEFLNILNIKGNYTYLNKIIKDISDKPIIFFKNKKITTYFWFALTEVDDGNIKIKFNQEILPNLLNLKKNFTQYSLQNVLDLNSKYDIKLYEIFKSVLGGKEKYIYIVDIEEFKKLLNIENMPFSKIKQSILNNINLSRTDIDVKYNIIKQNKKVIKIKFLIIKNKEKERIKEIRQIETNNNKILFDYDKKWFVGLKESKFKKYCSEFEFTEKEITKELIKMSDWIARKTKLKNKDWTEDIEKWLEKAWDSSAWQNEDENY